MTRKGSTAVRVDWKIYAMNVVVAPEPIAHRRPSRSAIVIPQPSKQCTTQMCRMVEDPITSPRQHQPEVKEREREIETHFHPRNNANRSNVANTPTAGPIGIEMNGKNRMPTLRSGLFAAT